MSKDHYQITDWMDAHMRERLAEIYRRGPKPGHESEYVKIVENYERELAGCGGIGSIEERGAK